MCICAQSRPALCNLMDCSPPSSSVHGIFPGKNTGVGCYFLLWGIFLTQVSNSHLLRLLHCKRIFFFLPLHHIYIGVFQLSISENSRYISSVFHLLERWEEGRQCWQTAKQLLDYLDEYAVNLLRYFPLVLIVVLNSLKTEKKFLYFTIELTAQLEEKYCWNLSMNVANLCCIYRQEEN